MASKLAQRLERNAQRRIEIPPRREAPAGLDMDFTFSEARMSLRLTADSLSRLIADGDLEVYPQKNTRNSQ